MSARPAISVVIVDDHPLFGEALARAVSARDDMTVVAQAASGEEALAAVRDHSPDVCVLDLGLPDMGGERVLEQIIEEGHRTRVLVLSGVVKSEVVYDMIQAGAGGFELKTAGPEEIGRAISAVARGETFLPEELHSGIAEQIRSHRGQEQPTLSERETEILQLVSDGLSAADIGHQLGMAESTTKTHLARIYDKLSVSERAAAVARAMRLGLIN